MCSLSPNMHWLDRKEGRMHARHLAWNYTQTPKDGPSRGDWCRWAIFLGVPKGMVGFGSWSLPPISS